MTLATNRPCSLYPEDTQIVQKYGSARGLGFSAALRLIIREWDQMKRDGVVLPHPADAQPVPVMYVTEKEPQP